MPIVKLSPRLRRARLWFLSAVVVGLLPLIWDIVHHADTGEKQDWHTALATGDALVLSAALSGGCVYDLVTKTVRTDKGEDTRKVLVISALLAAAGATMWFGDMRNNVATAKHSAVWTLYYLGLTILVCLRALYLLYESDLNEGDQPSRNVVRQPPDPPGDAEPSGNPANTGGGHHGS